MVIVVDIGSNDPIHANGTQIHWPEPTSSPQDIMGCEGRIGGVKDLCRRNMVTSD